MSKRHVACSMRFFLFFIFYFFSHDWFQDTSPKRHMRQVDFWWRPSCLSHSSPKANGGRRMWADGWMCSFLREWDEHRDRCWRPPPHFSCPPPLPPPPPALTLPSLTRHHPVTSLKGYSRSLSGLDVQTWAAGTRWWQ